MLTRSIWTSPGSLTPYTAVSFVVSCWVTVSTGNLSPISEAFWLDVNSGQNRHLLFIISHCTLRHTPRRIVCSIRYLSSIWTISIVLGATPFAGGRIPKRPASSLETLLLGLSMLFNLGPRTEWCIFFGWVPPSSANPRVLAADFDCMHHCLTGVEPFFCLFKEAFTQSARYFREVGFL